MIEITEEGQKYNAAGRPGLSYRELRHFYSNMRESGFTAMDISASIANNQGNLYQARQLLIKSRTND